DRFHIVDIIRQTPEIPESCQWALFLRNHDELTLEMVTDEERDYMYRMYATDHQMRLNLGIRRRLSPLLGNNRKKIELINGLLFSLPGTPVIYYGDEINMGDNIYLGDRNGVRTPMQWSGSKNAGFSACNPQRLYLPTIIDPEYHYQTINVETQQTNLHSIFWWMKRIIAIRKKYKPLSRGAIKFLEPDNYKILAFLREYEGEIILAVFNMSRFSQSVELDLSSYENYTPVEIFGMSKFPKIEDKYPLSLGPHTFYWFLLEKEKVKPEEKNIKNFKDRLPLINVYDKWKFFTNTKQVAELEKQISRIVVTRRWFASKGEKIKKINIVDHITIPTKEN
ncbi:MAG: alpha-glucosidase C-terminal domain-containing protein, partial [Actinomycetota bacterium]|nr:alpha-glucosidase C-terminal domain-containing protein [Actinomycetota bacterium]